MGDGARGLDRAGRTARELGEQLQRLDHRRLADDTAPDRTEALLAGHDAAIARGNREMHETNRLARRRATGTCDAGDRHREVDVSGSTAG